MKALIGNKQLLSEGRRLEQAGQLESAAAVYQRMVDADPGNQEAMERLLVVYRRLKDYPKELAVIDVALQTVAERNKVAQQTWLTAHPKAAKLGKQVLRFLGGESVTAYGTNPEVQKLLKRKGLVERRIDGVKGKKAKKGTAVITVEKRTKTANRNASAQPTVAKKKSATKLSEDRKRADRQRKAVAKARREATEQRKRIERQRKKTAAAARRETAEKKRQEVEARKEAMAQAKQAAVEAKVHPSLFIVSLRYLVPLEKIDAAMKNHVAFLDKYFAKGDFLVSGRQVPRTGGIIVARGKDRAAVERIMKQDPFVMGKLVSIDIVEFRASKTAKGLRRFI